METSLVVAARMSLASVGDDSDASSGTKLFSSFRGIDKGCKLFKSGHVQQIKMVGGEKFSFVRCNVLKRIPPLLPSQFQRSNGIMRLIFESSLHVHLPVKRPE